MYKPQNTKKVIMSSTTRWEQKGVAAIVMVLIPQGTHTATAEEEEKL